MAELLGIMSWPGVAQVIDGTLTHVQGVSPSVCTLTIAPQTTPVAEHGTLTLSFANVLMTFPGCKVDRAAFSYSQSGQLIGLSIYDRRWRWQFGGVSGSYNQRHPNLGTAPLANDPLELPLPIPPGVIDPRTEAAPQVLAATLLHAMGELVFDVSQLPNDTRPEVYWDRDNPAQELARLADSLGCRVVLGIDNVVRVCRVGVGAQLPVDFLMYANSTVDPPERPDSIAVVGNRCRYQADLVLEAVGEEVDGTIVPIDQLSYKPANGWRYELPDECIGFMGVPGWEVNPLVPPNLFQVLSLGYRNPRELARRSVFRWYRVKMSSLEDQGKKPLIPGWRGNPGERIDMLWQILPLLDSQVEGWFDEVRLFHPYPAAVFGQFYQGYWVTDAGSTEPPYNNTPPGSFCYFDFYVNTARGVVEFQQPLFFQEADGSVSEAQLVLRTAVNVRDFRTGAWERYERTFPVPGPEALTRPLVVRKEEIDYWVVPALDPQTHRVSSLQTSQDDCDRQAGYYAEAALLDFQLTTPLDSSYMGLLPISPDGAIRQVTWSVGPGGATTRASRNTEWSPVVPGYRERRLIEQLRHTTPTLQRLIDQERRE